MDKLFVNAQGLAYMRFRRDLDRRNVAEALSAASSSSRRPCRSTRADPLCSRMESRERTSEMPAAGTPGSCRKCRTWICERVGPCLRFSPAVSVNGPAAGAGSVLSCSLCRDMTPQHSVELISAFGRFSARKHTPNQLVLRHRSLLGRKKAPLPRPCFEHERLRDRLAGEAAARSGRFCSSVRSYRSLGRSATRTAPQV